MDFNNPSHPLNPINPISPLNPNSPIYDSRTVVHEYSPKPVSTAENYVCVGIVAVCLAMIAAVVYFDLKGVSSK
jgi:hypothetical protein